MELLSSTLKVHCLLLRILMSLFTASSYKYVADHSAVRFVVGSMVLQVARHGIKELPDAQISLQRRWAVMKARDKTMLSR
jgi:hypothetical protein